MEAGHLMEGVTMLVFTRKPSQSIQIGNDVRVILLAIDSRGRARLGIEAPANVRIDRQEVADRNAQAQHEATRQ
jgi:carbon storage regulator CsrA